MFQHFLKWENLLRKFQNSLPRTSSIIIYKIVFNAISWLLWYNIWQNIPLCLASEISIVSVQCCPSNQFYKGKFQIQTLLGEGTNFVALFRFIPNKKLLQYSSFKKKYNFFKNSFISPTKLEYINLGINIRN